MNGWLKAEIQSRADGISEQYLLAWYIGAVINKFHPTISQAWQSNDPGTRAKRNPAAFFPDSFDSFLAQVARTPVLGYVRLSDHDYKGNFGKYLVGGCPNCLGLDFQTISQC